MTQRPRPQTTLADVEQALEKLRPLLTPHIPRDAELVLEHGSPTYGRVWRLYYRQPPSHRLKTIPVEGLNQGWPAMGYLGWTKREAVETMREVRYRLELQCKGVK